VAPIADLVISLLGGVDEIPISINFSTLKASQVLKKLPTLWALRTLSKTTISGSLAIVL
jgi:hypothetical protein